MSKTTLLIGPDDHGRPMSLDDFEPAEGQPGYLYELGRGIVVVTEVPRPKHFAWVNATRRQFSAYDLAHPGVIYGIAGGGECKILLDALQSERHPDLAISKTPPPDEPDAWSIWIPELVVEVVSRGSEHRDDVEKREEYLAFGIREYWIIDAFKGEMLALRRARGRWTERIVRPPDLHRTPLLPGLAFDVAAVFQAR